MEERYFFLSRKYYSAGLAQAFQKSGLGWKLLEEVYADYKENIYPILQDMAIRLVSDFNQKKKELIIRSGAMIYMSYMVGQKNQNM